MASRRFPDSGSRYATRANGDQAKNGVIVYYLDAAGQNRAVVYAERGTDTPDSSDVLVNSQTHLDAYGGQLDFRGPTDGTDELFASVDGGPIFRVAAAPEPRLRDLESSSASDSLVVHKSGTESIDGTKTFSSSPLVPLTPSAAAAAASRTYVDTAVAAAQAAAIAAGVPATRQISAGTGLSGGGTLAADRSLTVAFGTTSTTVARGDAPADAQATAISTAATDATTKANAAAAASLPKVAGKNLFDSAATFGLDTFWNSVGTTPITLAGYYASARIPVTVGQAYTINNCRNYQFNNSSNAATFFFNNAAQTPVTFTVPSGVTTVAYSVSAANLATSQMETGSSVTTYEPYGYVVARQITAGAYLSDVAGNVGALQRMPGVTVYRSGTQLLARGAFDATQDVLMPLSTSNGLESMFAFANTANPYVTLVPSGTSDSLVWPTISTGTAIHGAVDDNCPINVQWAYVGGNHGYTGGSQVTMTAHGKTTADVGSTWTDGTRTYTLLQVVDVNTLLFGNQYSVSSGIVTASVVLPAASLTHVSGATHTATVTISGGTVNAQIHPSSHTHSVTVALDGRDVADGKAAGQVLTVVETYLIASYKGLIDTAQANIGTPVSTIMTSVPGLARVSNTYRFTGAQVVLSQRVTAIEKTTINMGVTQALPLTVYSGGSKKQFMAGIGTAGGLNFSTLADLAGMAADIDITPATYLNATAPAVGMSQWVYDASSVAQYGLAMGFLPVADSHPLQRIKNAATKSWFITNSVKKNYPQIAWAKTLNIGDSLSGTAYRRYLAPPDTTTELQLSDGAGTWAVLERIGTVTDARMAAPALLGRRLVPVGITTAVAGDRVTGDGITYSVPVSPGYGLWQATAEAPRLEVTAGAATPVGTYFVMNQGAVTTQALTGSYQILYLYPYYLAEAAPVDRVCVEVTTLGTGVLRHGIYPNDPNTGQPSLIAPYIDFGTVDITSTGIKETTIASVLPPGWHWYGQVWQVTNTTAPALRVCSLSTGMGPMNIGTSSASMSAGRYGYYMTGVTGALGALTLVGPHQLAPPRLAYRRA